MSTSEEIIINAILAGTREYLANAQRVVAANEEIAGSTEMVGRSMERTSKRSYLMNQAIFTTRRLMYGLTLATVGSGAMALKWGWQFNSAMQQARVAMEKVFPSTEALNKELDYLFNFTKYTPFQFKDVTIAFRMLYAAFHPLGISVETTNQTLKSLTDALAYAGKTSPMQLNRVALALQHMAYQGHLTGYAVNQLSRDGVPMMAILRKEFGLTGDQIHRIGTLGIPTLDVLKAINHYIATTPGFQDAARRQAMMTLHGQFTTFKDNMGQIMGAVEKGWFAHLQGLLTRTNNFFGGAGNILQHGGNITDVLRLAGGSGAVMLWTRLTDVLRQFWITFSTVVQAVARSRVFWAAVYAALTAIAVVLHIINPFLQAFGGVLVAFLIPALVTWYTVTKVAAFWTGMLALEEALATKATKELSFFQFLAAIATGRYALSQKLATFWTAAGTVAMRAYVVATTLLTWALQRETIAAVMAWAATLGPITLILVALAAVAAAIYLIIRYWDQLKSTLQTNALLGVDPSTIRHSKPGRHRSAWGNFWHALTTMPGGAGSGVPGMAMGGSVTRGGLSWVGERGPELLSLPVGASVMPNHEAFNMRESWMGGQRPITVIAKTYLDGRQIAESVADVEASDGARS